MKTTYYIILLLVLTVFGCRKDTESEKKTTTQVPGPVVVGYAPSVEKVAADFGGFVHDQTDQPIANAIVTFGSNSVITNNVGYFSFSSSTLNKYGQAIKVEHPSYHDNVFRVYPTANSTNWLKFKLSNKLTTQINSNVGGLITFAGGGTLQISRNSLITPADTLYNGVVDVSIRYIDVNEPGNQHAGAGNHFGISKLTNEVVVSSLGMLAIEVTAANGLPLSIIDIDTLLPRLVIPVSSSYTGNTPSTIPSWAFYEPYAAWIQGEEMNKNGSFYSGRLRYFNYVNVGLGYPANYFEAQTLDNNNNPLTNSIIKTQVDSVLLGFDVVDDQGNISGYYPEQQSFDFVLYDLCSKQTQVTIPPTLGVQNIGPIVLSATSTLVNANVTCNGIPFNDYNILVSSDFSENYYRATPGSTIAIPACSDTSSQTTITILDPSGQLTRNVQIILNSNNSLGIVDLCNTGPTDYIQFDYGTANYTLLDPVVDTINNATVILLNNGFLQFNGTTAGTYAGSGLNVFNYDAPNLYLTGYMDTLIVSTYTNNALIGTFKGTAMDTVSQTNVFIDGDFNIVQ